MDERSKDYLDSILEKTPSELTEEECSFLRARRSYLRKGQLLEFSNILDQTPKQGTVNKNGKSPKTK